MKILSGKKLILLGERDGIPARPWEACLARQRGGGRVFGHGVLCLNGMVLMDLQNQQRILDAVKKYGADRVVVLLGSADADGAALQAETVTTGDPTFAGPLAGVSLGLPVIHVLDEAIKAEADPAAWEQQVSMMEMVLDGEVTCPSGRAGA